MLNICIFSIAHAPSILIILLWERLRGEALPIYTDQPVNCQAFILSQAFRIDFTFPSFTLTLLAYKQAGGCWFAIHPKCYSVHIQVIGYKIK